MDLELSGEPAMKIFLSHTTGNYVDDINVCCRLCDTSVSRNFPSEKEELRDVLTEMLFPHFASLSDCRSSSWLGPALFLLAKFQ